MEGVNARENHARQTARAPDVNNMQIVVFSIYAELCVRPNNKLLLVLRPLRPEFELFCQIC